MKLIPWLFTGLLVSGCLPETESIEPTPDEERCTQPQKSSCPADMGDQASNIEDPGPLTLNSVVASPTGVITDYNQAALIEAGLNPNTLVVSSGVFLAFYLDVDTAEGIIECESGSGLTETLEADSDTNTLSNITGYSVTNYLYNECISPIVAPIGSVKLNGKTSLENRAVISGLVTASHSIKASATNFSAITTNANGSESTVTLNGSSLTTNLPATEKSTIEFNYLSETTSETGQGTFHFYSLTPTQRYDGDYESGSWVIEDANGASIHFIVTGSENNSVSVTARGVAMGEYEL